jgi:HD-like signal output (HDOD) protein
MLQLRSENVNFRTLAELIGKDPGLSAEVLRYANSAFYAGMNEIKRLDLAFARLGHRALRARVMAVSFKGLSIRTGGPERSRGEELWRRSLACGVILAEMAPRYGLSRDDAFLVGLLHDVGCLAVLRVVHEYQTQMGQRVPAVVFHALCQQWHEKLGANLSEAWNLPDPLPALIGSHHVDAGPEDPLEYYRLLIAFAEVVCAMTGYSPHVPYDFFNTPCVKRLGLQDDGATRAFLAALPEKIAGSIRIP